MKAQVYKDPRPAEHFDRFHERTRAKRPNWMYEFVRLVLTPYLLFFFRTRCIDSHKVPADGPVIVAPNHFSFLDHFFVAVYLRRKVQFMAKSQLFKRPLQVVYHNGGVFPVRRGHRDEEAFKTAHAVLARGGIVVMYCEGGRSRTGELGEPAAASAGWRSSRAPRSCPRRSWAPSACATGSASSSRRSRSSSASRSGSSASRSRPRTSPRPPRRTSSRASATSTPAWSAKAARARSAAPATHAARRASTPRQPAAAARRVAGVGLRYPPRRAAALAQSRSGRAGVLISASLPRS